MRSLNYIFKNLTILIVLFLCFQINISAAENISIIKFVTKDTGISAYINADISDCTASIGTVQCEVNSYEKVCNMPSETLILVDTSGSIPSDIRDKIKEFLNVLIENKNENERYAIASFGTEISYLCDYSADRYDLAKAVEKIEYDQSYTYIYSALDNVLKDVNTDIFTKIVIISDGVENSKDGITYDEILKTVTDKMCPVYTIGFENKNQEQLKKFYAFARNSYAQSYTLTSDTNVAEVSGVINATREYTCINIDVPAELSDGSIKYLNINGDDFECGIDIRMPIVMKQETETSLSETTIEETSISEFVENGTPTQSKINIWTIIIPIALIIVAVTVILIIKKTICIHKKNCTNDTSNTIVEALPTKIPTHNVPDFEKSIMLTDIKSPEHSFRCSIKDGIIVGRDPKQCMIAINYNNDGYISRRHIKIFMNDYRIIVENISTHGKVIINDKYTIPPVSKETSDSPAGGTRILLPNGKSNVIYEKEVFHGDIIQIGHTSLKIEIL